VQVIAKNSDIPKPAKPSMSQKKNVVTFSPGKAMAEKVQKKRMKRKKMPGDGFETVKKPAFSGRPET